MNNYNHSMYEKNGMEICIYWHTPHVNGIDTMRGDITISGNKECFIVPKDIAIQIQIASKDNWRQFAKVAYNLYK